ncbi:MAG: methyltransferase domain-containing protein [Saprospiraceae bacterium]
MQSSYADYASILKCPMTKESVRYTDKQSDYKQFLDGQTVEHGFLNTSGTCFYPIVEGIICMLPDASAADRVDFNVQRVRNFYNEFGWEKDDQGRFNDSRLFIEKKSAAQEYYTKTTERLHRFLRPSGKYVLDVASGPVFQPENQAFSRHFEKRICVDISIKALREARRNVGDEHGIFIHGDITNLPLATEVCDNVMCIHTLYHVPRELQEAAVAELIRVCKPDSNIIILYNWAWHSWLMNVLLLPVRILKASQRLYRYCTVSAKDRWLSGGLYFYPHPPAWFERLASQNRNVQVRFHPLTSIHQDFIKYYIHNGLGGAWLLCQVLRLEERYPRYLGRHGAFAFVVLRKGGSSLV